MKQLGGIWYITILIIGSMCIGFLIGENPKSNCTPQEDHQQLLQHIESLEKGIYDINYNCQK